MRLLRARAGELEGLGEGERGDRAGARDERGIGGQDAVDVGPQLHLLGAERGAEDGGREVRALVAEGGGDARRRGADVAPDDGHPPGHQERRHRRAQPLRGRRVVGVGAGEEVVGHQHLPAVEAGGVDPGVAEGLGEDGARQHLAERGDDVGERGVERRAWPIAVSAASRAAKRSAKTASREPASTTGPASRSWKARRRAAPSRARSRRPGRRGLGRREQVPGGLRHRRDDDERPAVELAADEADDAADARGRADRAAAELLDDHGRDLLRRADWPRRELLALWAPQRALPLSSS